MTRRSRMMLATILTGMTSIALFAAATPTETGDRSQTRAIEADVEVRNLDRTAAGAATPDRHLTLSERITFDPADPVLGPLERVALDVTLYVEQGFSGLIGDGAPLAEAPDPVEIETGMTTRVDIVGPDGGHLLATMVPTARISCASRGSCTFTHHERRPVTLRFEPPRSAFTGERPVTLILRATTTGGVLSQLCKPGEGWERCQVRQARIGLTVPKDGIRLSYIHEAAMAPATVARDNHISLLLAIGCAALALGFGAVVWMVIARMRRPTAQA